MHIHQESALANLLLAGCSLLSNLRSRGNGSQACSRVLVASWVVQTVLGALSVVLGGTLYIGHYLAMYSEGAPFWTGIVAMLAGGRLGMLSAWLIGCWALMRTLLVLASFCTAVAAIVIGSRELNFYWYFLGDDVCQRDSSYGWSTMPRTTPVPEEADRIALCIYYTSMLKTLLMSLQAMLLGIWVLLLLASLTPALKGLSPSRVLYRRDCPGTLGNAIE